jgi:hypothetical protein
MSSIVGSWDLTVHRPSGEFPSWFEITENDGSYEGRYVGIWGSSRPILSIQLDGNDLEFALPSQYEGVKTDLVFRLTVDGDTCTGTAVIWDAEPYSVSGNRAPSMVRSGTRTDGESIDLLADGLEGFAARWPDMEFHWSMIDGVLVNAAKGTDLITKALFSDFRLEAEYTYPTGSNSGIYLRGRYEFQILDDFGSAPSVGSSAAIYGFFAPTENAVKPADEWNSAVIEFVGRDVSVTLNGKTVVKESIPGITGGAMDAHEGEPGPILLQGDHGPVSFRKLTLTPISFD